MNINNPRLPAIICKSQYDGTAGGRADSECGGSCPQFVFIPHCTVLYSPKIRAANRSTLLHMYSTVLYSYTSAVRSSKTDVAFIRLFQTTSTLESLMCIQVLCTVLSSRLEQSRAEQSKQCQVLCCGAVGAVRTRRSQGVAPRRIRDCRRDGLRWVAMAAVSSNRRGAREPRDETSRWETRDSLDCTGRAECPRSSPPEPAGQSQQPAGRPNVMERCARARVLDYSCVCVRERERGREPVCVAEQCGSAASRAAASEAIRAARC